MIIKNCPGCLREGFDTYCASCRKKLFLGKKVSHILSFSKPEFEQQKRERIDRLSISGVQIKHSLKLEKGRLVLTEKNGQYILKPIPTSNILNKEVVPMNEHLTMQIAKQVFGLSVAENALVFFSDGDPAYIVKRFDRNEKGEKRLQEDFAQIAGRTEDTNGENYKYDFSYEEIADLMKRYVAAYKIEIEKYFKAILFNYIIGNGDAHIKNFSLYRTEKYDDYRLTPFYDLLCTTVHFPQENDLALDLFKNDFMTENYKHTNTHIREDFEIFAQRVGIREIRYKKIIDTFLTKEKEVESLVNRSYLSEDMKDQYYENFLQRLTRIKD